jgi:hypothetical protein
LLTFANANRNKFYNWPFILKGQAKHMADQYNIIIGKLHRFIRKYYINRMLRGIMYFISLFALFFLLLNIFEYYSWSSTQIRTLLFYTYLFLNFLIFFRLVLLPLLKLFRIGRVMSDEEAARIIGRHFPEVGDTLINTIQLKNLSRELGMAELLNAGIEQKTRKLHPVPFLHAVSFGENKKYLRYLLPPLLLIVALLFTAPATITEPSQRLIRHRQAFEKPMPFRLILLNDKLEALQQDDFMIRFATAGEKLPDQVQLMAGNNLFPFQKDASGNYHYTLKNLQQDVTFRVMAGEYVFGPYLLKVLPKPVIINYEAELTYPSYTGKTAQNYENTGDFVAPEGTKVSWKFFTRDTRMLSMRFPDENVDLPMAGSNTFQYERILRQSISYSVSAMNEHVAGPDTLSYAITVIPDQYPVILIEEFSDSLFDKQRYFQGQISDDYGFTALTFNYEFLNHFDSLRIEGKIYTEDVLFSPAIPRQVIFHHFNLDRLQIMAGDEIAYYFEVWDNDEINGYKRSRSQRMIFRAPTEEEISTRNDTDNRLMKDEMGDLLREARMLQDQIERFNKQMVDKETLSWQDKEQIKNMVEQQQQLMERMELLQQQNMQKNTREQQYKDLDESIMQKQQQLQELFDELMSEEMKELFREMQEMLDKINKENVNEMLEQLQMSAEEIEESLDRNLELFRQLEFDKKLTETIEKLNELAEEQLRLSEESLESGADSEEIKNEQEELSQAFDEIRHELDRLDEMNQEMEKPHELMDTQEQEESIMQEQQNSMDQLERRKMKNAGGSQKKAGEEMKDLAEMLFNMQMEMFQESAYEDLRAIRQILDNLLFISFDQESLMDDLARTNIADPRYQDMIRKQHGIEDNMKIVKDSLLALSKRQIMIEPFVHREVNKINLHISDAKDQLNDRKKGQAAASQQYVMTSVNNLALLLAEALDKLQQMNNMNMPGDASCKNPGGSSPGKMPENMSEMQKQLNQQLQKMKDGQKMDGQQGKQGQKSMSEQFARMAAEQEAIRRQMQQYLEELKAQGETGDAGLNKLMDDMEQTELDLVNKRLNEETIQRQEEILTRLLKHEKAMREREKEERRESKEVKNHEQGNPGEFLEYNKLLLKEVELLKTVPPDLKPYYKRKVNEYFYNFGN